MSPLPNVTAITVNWRLLKKKDALKPQTAKHIRRYNPSHNRIPLLSSDSAQVNFQGIPQLLESQQIATAAQCEQPLETATDARLQMQKRGKLRRTAVWRDLHKAPRRALCLDHPPPSHSVRARARGPIRARGIIVCMGYN